MSRSDNTRRLAYSVSDSFATNNYNNIFIQEATFMASNIIYIFYHLGMSNVES